MTMELTWTMKEFFKTCISNGCTVDEKDPKDIQKEIGEGDSKIPLDRSI